MDGALALLDAPEAPHAVLAGFPDELRGFAVEGAAMSAGLLDLTGPQRPWRVRLLLAGSGVRYRYLTHVGAGWAMCMLGRRTPSTAWGLDPLLRWLALDGAGFCRTFFRASARRPRGVARGARSLRDRVILQGVGRSLWFVRGADQEVIADFIQASHPTNRGPLWAGVGLASAYCGAPLLDQERLTELAGHHVAQLRQGVRFALAAHGAAGNCSDTGWESFVGGTPAETELAAMALAEAHSCRRASLKNYVEWQRSLEREEMFG